MSAPLSGTASPVSRWRGARLVAVTRRGLGDDERIACQGADLDLTAITQASPAITVEAARALCSECPALGACLTYLETTEVAGFAGGMFELQRKRWRRRDRTKAEALTITEVSEAGELHGPLLDGLQFRRGVHALAPQLIDLVRRLTAAGLTAEEILTRVNDPRLNHRTIKYIRIKYGSKDTLTEARLRRNANDAKAAERRKVVREWAISEGVPVPVDPKARLSPDVLQAYRVAHRASA